MELFKSVSFDLSPADILNSIKVSSSNTTTSTGGGTGSSQDNKRKHDGNDDEEPIVAAKRVQLNHHQELPSDSSMSWSSPQLPPAENDFATEFNSSAAASAAGLAIAAAITTADTIPVDATLPPLTPPPLASAVAGPPPIPILEHTFSVNDYPQPSPVPFPSHPMFGVAAVADANPTVLLPPSNLDLLTNNGGDDSMKSSCNFSNLDDDEFQKIYEILVISNFIKLYPEIVSDMSISRSALMTYDDETRRKKFSSCKLYVLIQIESSSINGFTNLIGLVLRVAIHFLFPSGISKSANQTLTRLLESTEKKASAMFYFHAISNLKKRNYEAPSIFYGYLTELLKVVSTLATEYMMVSSSSSPSK